MNRLEPSPPFRVLVALSGLGLGNSTRQEALLEELADQLAGDGRTLDALVCGWGRAATYFRHIPRYRFEELLPYPAGPFTYFRNCYRIFRALRTQRPDLVLLDSDYHFPAYFFLRARTVYLGQAWNTVAAVREARINWSWRQWCGFLVKEVGDGIYQRIFASLVLAPGFVTRTAFSSAGLARIPLLVRRAYRAPTKHEKRNGWAVLLSGSGLQDSALRRFARQNELALIAPSSSGEPTDTHRPLLDEYEGVVLQCGLSSLSEAIARRRPMVLVPMVKHPEQELNALAITRLGWGVLGEPELSRSSLAAASRASLPAEDTNAMTNGAAVAAALALRHVSGGTAP